MLTIQTILTILTMQAMADQSLDHNEQLNVRWAYEDPNPRAQVGTALCEGALGRAFF